MSPCAPVAAEPTVLKPLEVGSRCARVAAGRTVVDALEGGSLAGGVPPAASSLPGDLQAHLLRGEASEELRGMHRLAGLWQAACQETYKLFRYV